MMLIIAIFSYELNMEKPESMANESNQFMVITQVP